MKVNIEYNVTFYFLVGQIGVGCMCGVSLFFKQRLKEKFSLYFNETC